MSTEPTKVCYYPWPCIIIVTTEVQLVVFTPDHSIQCTFLRGSDVSGCVYVLVPKSEVQEMLETITGFIDRSTASVSIMVANIGCYSEVLAYANTTGVLPVRAKITTDEECTVSTGLSST